jgi:hypothetical protein
MGCCSPFSATTTAAAADPSRHVSFTSGMVLGVDDYVQEFAYHAARDKWIVRDFLGHGTLSGLAVGVEDDGANGPRVRVTPGAAAAPSGQLICVGREQCGSLNAWLGRDDIKEKVRRLADLGVDKDHVTLNLFLTLCYVDCAVAEVPIPGEPCRSDENLMAPSRIADDYCLSFEFEPPPMAEALAVPALDAFWTGIDVGGGNPNTAAAFATALKRAELQLLLAAGVYPPDAPAPSPADLAQIKLNNAAVPRFANALRRLWVTKVRPTVAAQRCSAASVPANDCVLLAILDVPAVKVATHWEVNGAAAAIGLDETDRPILLSAQVAQSTFGADMSASAPDQNVAFVTTAGQTLDKATRIAVIRSDAAIDVSLPKASDAGLGKELTVKASGDGIVTVKATAPSKIDGAAQVVLAKRGALSLVSDGDKAWHVTGLVR